MSELKTISDKTWSQAEAIAQDERYRDDFKQEQVNDLFLSTMGSIESAYKAEKARISSSIEAAKKVYVSPMPAPEEASALLYMRDAIKPRWEAESLANMESAWQAAIDNGDKLTARLYRDYAPPMISQKMGVSGVTGRTQAMIEATDKLLLSKEGLEALNQIEAGKSALFELETTYSAAKSRFTGAVIRQGKLISGTSFRTERAIRRYT